MTVGDATATNGTPERLSLGVAARLARYLERIPVIALDGEELFDYFVDEHALRRALA